MKKYRLRLHRKTLDLLNDPEYVCICISTDEKMIAVYPCEEQTGNSVRVSSSRDGEIYSMRLFEEFIRLRPDLRTDISYRIDGGVFNTGVAEFCIMDATAIDSINGIERNR